MQQSIHYSSQGFEYQLFSAALGPALSFVAILLIYWIKDRDPLTREFERQNKRLEFWKSFYALQERVANSADSHRDVRCQALLRTAETWIATVQTKAYALAKFASALAIFLAACLLYSIFDWLAALATWPCSDRFAFYLFIVIGLQWFLYIGFRNWVAQFLYANFEWCRQSSP